MARPLPPSSSTTPSPAVRPAEALWLEPFDTLDSSRWRHIMLQGHTDYEAVDLDGRRCLAARSRQAASILVADVRIDPQDALWLSWQWRVDRLVEGEALDRKDGSDAAARLYVYFESTGLPWQKRNLDYLWSAALPVGTALRSAYSSKSKLIVVEHGPGALGQWRMVERNLVDDYRRYFGDAPPRLIAVGIMNDTDNTGSDTVAYFDELRLSRSPLTAGETSHGVNANAASGP